MTTLLIAAMAVWLWWCLVFVERKPFIFALTAPIFIAIGMAIWPIARLIEIFNLTVYWVFDHPTDW